LQRTPRACLEERRQNIRTGTTDLAGAGLRIQSLRAENLKWRQIPLQSNKHAGHIRRRLGKTRKRVRRRLAQNQRANAKKGGASAALRRIASGAER